MRCLIFFKITSVWALVLLGAPSVVSGEEVSSTAKIEAIEKKNSFKDYHRPILDPDETKIIKEVIHTLATANIFKLPGLKSGLYKKGKKIDHVHPLRQLVYIFTNPDLKEDFRQVSKRSIVWRQYSSEMGDVLALEAGRNNLIEHVEDFAAALKVSPSTARSYLNRKKWRDFLEWLIETTDTRF